MSHKNSSIKKQVMQSHPINISTNSASFIKQHNSNNNSNKNIKTLMQSIENKLSLLAADNDDINQRSKHQKSKVKQIQSYLQAQSSEIDIKNQNDAQLQVQTQKFTQQPFAIQQKTAQRDRRLHLRQLQTSYQQKSSQKKQFMKQSRVLSRINQMQEFYMKQIKQLNFKIIYLQNQTEQLKQKNLMLKAKNQQLQSLVNKNQKDFKYKLNKQMESIKDSLISKFSKQAEASYQGFFIELNNTKQQLEIQKKKNKQLEDQFQLVLTEKSTLEQFYRQLLENHKKLLLSDINQSQNNLGAYSQHSYFQPKVDILKNSNKNKNNKKIIKEFSKSQSEFLDINKDVKSQTNRKNKRKAHHSKDQIKILDSPNRQQYSREQLIPILAKGIQQLKQKLNMK